jgi:hypothetical protein
MEKKKGKKKNDGTGGHKQKTHKHANIAPPPPSSATTYS